MAFAHSFWKESVEVCCELAGICFFMAACLTSYRQDITRWIFVVENLFSVGLSDAFGENRKEHTSHVKAHFVRECKQRNKHQKWGTKAPKRITTVSLRRKANFDAWKPKWRMTFLMLSETKCLLFVLLEILCAGMRMRIREVVWKTVLAMPSAQQVTATDATEASGNVC